MEVMGIPDRPRFRFGNCG